MPAVPIHHTAVIDVSWDGNAQETKLVNPIPGAVGKAMYAWYDAGGKDPDKDGYPDQRADWKFPHHDVGSDGKPGAAVKVACSAGIGRIGSAKIPAGDDGGVRDHLQAHLDDFAKKGQAADGWDVGDRDALAALASLETEGHVWAIRGELAARLSALHGQSLSIETVYALEARRGGRASTGNGVAVIPLKGVITPAPSLFAMLFGGGGGGLEEFVSDLSDAAADPDVKHIVLDVDSPGGLVDGVPEAAVEIRRARESKPIVAVSNTGMMSAAYWLASQAHEVVVTPSGEVGSIGVYQLHKDLSEAHAMRGIAPTLISAGRYKVEGNPYEPLSDEARQAAQDGVDDFYNMFTSDVAKGRGVAQSDVKAGYGEGRALTAKRAVSAGLADRVATLADTVRRLSSGRAQVRQTAGAVDDVSPGEAVEIAYTRDELASLFELNMALRAP
jgi:capsid assembly protease